MSNEVAQILTLLKEPFPTKVIHWRIGSTTKNKEKGLPLAYVDARDVMKKLDDVVGPENWMDDFISDGNMTICKLSLRLNGEWIHKSDAAGNTKVEGEKGAASTAFKRAAAKFGVGRYLYYLPDVWVPLQNGKLPKNFSGQLPKWAIPADNK